MIIKDNILPIYNKTGAAWVCGRCTYYKYNNCTKRVQATVEFDNQHLSEIRICYCYTIGAEYLLEVCDVCL